MTLEVNTTFTGNSQNFSVSSFAVAVSNITSFPIDSSDITIVATSTSQFTVYINAVEIVYTQPTQINSTAIRTAINNAATTIGSPLNVFLGSSYVLGVSSISSEITQRPTNSPTYTPTNNPTNNPSSSIGQSSTTNGNQNSSAFVLGTQFVCYLQLVVLVMTFC